MIKKISVGIFILLTFVFMIGCSVNNTNEVELSDAEIQEILSEVTGGEETLKSAGIRYFSELSSDNNNIIKPDVLNELISTKGDSVYILDIRKEKDFKKGHIKGAHNSWWFDVGEDLDELPQDKRIVVTCYSGQSAGQVVGVLRMMGYDAASLLGGMNNGWYANDMPVEQ